MSEDKKLKILYHYVMASDFLMKRGAILVVGSIAWSVLDTFILKSGTFFYNILYGAVVLLVLMSMLALIKVLCFLGGLSIPAGIIADLVLAMVVGRATSEEIGILVAVLPFVFQAVIKVVPFLRGMSAIKAGHITKEEVENLRQCCKAQRHSGGFFGKSDDDDYILDSYRQMIDYQSDCEVEAFQERESEWQNSMDSWWNND